MSSKGGASTVQTCGSSVTKGFRLYKDDDESIPIISHSVISLGSEAGEDNHVTKLEIIPSSPDEHPFLQLEPPCYIGPSLHYRDPEVPEKPFSSKSHLLNVLPLEELKHKILTETEFKEPEKLAILDQMFPPRTFAADGKRWRIHVSKVPGGPDERLKLFQEFESLKGSRHASEKGYCPIMNDLIHGLFDECLRQEVLTCPERGILLAAIRNGLNRISMALEALYEGAQLKTMRTTTALNARKAELTAKVGESSSKIDQLRAEIASTKLKIKKAVAKKEEQLKKLKSKHEEEMDYQTKIANLAKTMCEKAGSELSASSPTSTTGLAVKGANKTAGKAKGSVGRVSAQSVMFTASRQQ